jgi:hypothetical protein
MHWKYHLEAGDAVRVRTSDGYGWGTVRGWVLDECPPKGCDVGDYELADYTIRVQSGDWKGNVTLDDVLDYQSEDERETDLPLLSEDMRLTGGVEQTIS